VFNQFETDVFTITSYQLLCVPSAKLGFTPWDRQRRPKAAREKNWTGRPCRPVTFGGSHGWVIASRTRKPIASTERAQLLSTTRYYALASSGDACAYKCAYRPVSADRFSPQFVATTNWTICSIFRLGANDFTLFGRI